MNDNLLTHLIAIFSAFLNAAATVLAALISKFNPNSRKSKHRRDPENLDTNNDGEFGVQENSTYFEPLTETTIAVHHVILDDLVNFEYTSLDQFTPVKVKNARVGWKGKVVHDDKEYAMTLLRIDGLDKIAIFNMRLLKASDQVVSKKHSGILTEDQGDNSKNRTPPEAITPRGVVVNCPNCGAALPISENLKQCKYCGASFA